MTSKYFPVRFSCGPDVKVGDMLLRGSNHSCHKYQVVAIEVHPRSNLRFTVREAIAFPLDTP